MENISPVVAVNPLTKYFRQIAIYTKLPTNGKFWPDGSLSLPANGEIPVYPMTTKDEVTLRTPDALMNGAGVVDVIQSCCPNIIDAWKMPSVDVDAVLIAIRIASYGHEMEFETKCPHCGEENKHGIDLRSLLSSISCPNYSEKLEVQGLKIKLKPQAYFGVNRNNTIEFEEQRMIQALQKPDIEAEVRAKEIASSMQRLIEIRFDTVTASTEYIETEDGTVVNDGAFIKEFYSSASGEVMARVQEKLATYNLAGGIKPPEGTCISCQKTYKVPLTFDYASFFGKGF